MKKYLLLLLLFVAAEAHAQIEPPKPPPPIITEPSQPDREGPSLHDRLRYGVNVSFNSTNFATLLGGGLMVLYMPLPKTYIGPGFKYTRLWYRQIDIQESLYGPTITARYDLPRIAGIQLFAQAEQEWLRGSVTNPNGVPSTTEWFPSTFVGGGISQPLSERASFNFFLAFKPGWAFDDPLYDSAVSFRSYLLF